MGQIHKIYASNFLTGLVFWYGIEKLFMLSIGITPYQVGTLTALFIIVTMLLDIPGGILADRWSRKGTLCLSAIFLAISALVLGTSNSFMPYLLGYMFYGLYIITSEGTYQAILYDSLHEINLHKQYSKINGKAYALFLTGAGVANIASGFLASHFGYRMPFYLSVITCLCNVVVIASMREPLYHKPALKEHAVRQLYNASKTIVKIRLLKVLAITMSLLTIIEYFKSDFGQLYMLRYVHTPQLLGLLWAAYAFTWALGAFIAHRLHEHLNLLIIASTMPIILMAFIDGWPALVFFALQAVAVAALFNQIETRIQDATPSHVRASVISVLSTIGRIVSIPAAITIGWILNKFNAYITIQAVSTVAWLVLIYWLYNLLRKHITIKRATN